MVHPHETNSKNTDNINEERTSKIYPSKSSPKTPFPFELYAN